MVVKVLDLLFAILSSFNLNLQLVGQILVAGKEAYEAAKAALSNQEEPTLEDIAAKASELRAPVDLTPEDN